MNDTWLKQTRSNFFDLMIKYFPTYAEENIME